MKRIRLTISYDGTNYCGWQIQKNAVTVEGVLCDALQGLLQEQVEIIGASRTDSGVHAMGNAAVFNTETKIPPEKIAIALNQRLPEDIRIQKSEETTADFHPRYCASIKTYEYTITNTPIQIPVWQRYSYHVYHVLDIEKMQRAARIFEGTHDFSAFCSAGSQVRTKIRTIFSVQIDKIPIEIAEDGSLIKIRICGNGFLYNMVRIIAGTLIEVGEGRRTMESISLALETGKRQYAGPTAPPQGLMLMAIQYDTQDKI